MKHIKTILAVAAVAAVGYYFWEKSKKDAANDSAKKLGFADPNPDRKARDRAQQQAQQRVAQQQAAQRAAQQAAQRAAQQAASRRH